MENVSVCSFLICYFIFSGIACNVLFFCIPLNSTRGEHGSSRWVQRLFYFLLGGAILPVTLITACVAVPLAHWGASLTRPKKT